MSLAESMGEEALQSRPRSRLGKEHREGNGLRAQMGKLCPVGWLSRGATEVDMAWVGLGRWT